MTSNLVSQWIRYAADNGGDTTAQITRRMLACNEIEKYAPQQPVPPATRSLVSQWMAYACHPTGDRTADLSRSMIAGREICVALRIN